MRVLCFSEYLLNFENFDTTYVYEENAFYDAVINKKFDVIVVSFSFFPQYMEVKRFLDSTVIFVNSYCDSFIYKKILEVADYCYRYDEGDKIYFRLKYLQKKLLKTKASVYKFGDLLYNFNTNELYKNSVPVKLSSAEKELLKTLIKNRNTFLSKDDILMECDSIESESSIKVLISHLRKLGFEIENQKNLGYRLKEK